MDAQDNTQKTPLHYAAQWGQEETLDFLIECGANVNAQDFIEDTPLHFVSHPSTVRGLPFRGVNVSGSPSIVRLSFSTVKLSIISYE